MSNYLTDKDQDSYSYLKKVSLESHLYNGFNLITAEFRWGEEAFHWETSASLSVAFKVLTNWILHLFQITDGSEFIIYHITLHQGQKIKVKSVHTSIYKCLLSLHNWPGKEALFLPEVGGSAHMCFSARLNPCWDAKKARVDFDVMIRVS